MVSRKVSLKPYNTFQVDIMADYFTTVNSINELRLVTKDFHSIPNLVLGGGSNLLFTKDFEGIVVKNQLLGVEVIKEDSQSTYIEVQSGEVWENFVQYCIERNLNGVENLTKIPGTVGAAPVQNIGAYGAEVKDVIELVECLDCKTGSIVRFTKEQCNFGYRDSIFKKEAKGKYIITSVIFKLSKNPEPNITYKPIQDYINIHSISPVTSKLVSQIISQIRAEKLPDPSVLGNAGSFFKNPEIPVAMFDKLKLAYPEIPGYLIGKESVKVPAAWLVEKDGWKEKRIGKVGVFEKQALIVVNLGGATGNEILFFARQIQESIYHKFGIQLEPEVNII